MRHGQSTWNAEQRWQGQADPPLSELGEQQARAAVPAVVAAGFARIVSSDLERARCTAALLAPTMPVEVAPAWRERHAGEWTGLTRAEIEATSPGAIARQEWPPGFEGDQAILDRVLPALHTLAAVLARGSSALVVTHGGVIRTLEARLGNRRRAVPNLGGSWIEVGAGAGAAELTLGETRLLIEPDDVLVTIPTQL